MAIFKNHAGDKVQALATAIKIGLQTQGNDIATATTAKNLASFESLNDADRGAVETSLENAAEFVRQMAGSVKGFEAFDETGSVTTDASMQAAAIAAAASADPSTYAQAALTSKAQPGQDVVVIEPELSGANGAIDSTDQVANESYDERNLQDFAHYSVVYNLQASRQDAFGEAFFPTVTVSPDQGGLDINVQSLMVFKEVRHQLTGRAADFKKRNLIDGFVDYTLLADEDTKVVPFKAGDSSNADKFVASALVAAYNVNVAGVAVATAPLAVGKEIDLLGLSSNPALIGAGVMDNTDALDARMALSAIYVDTVGDASKPAVKFSTANLARSQFQKTPEGNYREMGLQFTTRDIIIDKNTKAVDGSAIAEFAAIGTNNYVVRAAADVSGIANLEFGNVIVYTGALRVVEIRDAAGNSVDLTTGAGKTVADAVAASHIVGYDLEARRTNSNRRSRGTLVDTTYNVERYSIPLGSPLSIPRPVSSARDAADLKTLIAATRIRNSNDAVTTLLNYADTLRAYVRGPKFNDAVPGIMGAGRHFVTPFYEEHELDLLEATNSIRSMDRAADVSGAITNALRDIVYRMARDSKYIPALSALSGGAEETASVIVGTDPVLERHLIVGGDTRTFGEAFKDFAIVSSYDRRMRGTIFVTLSHKGANAPDPLTFGCMAWMPELTSAVDMTRNGALSREVMVQPRKLHVPLLPILAKVTVKNLSAVLADKTEAPAVADPSDGSWVTGISYP